MPHLPAGTSLALPGTHQARWDAQGDEPKLPSGLSLVRNIEPDAMKGWAADSAALASFALRWAIPPYRISLLESLF